MRFRAQVVFMLLSSPELKHSENLGRSDTISQHKGVFISWHALLSNHIVHRVNNKMNSVRLIGLFFYCKVQSPRSLITGPWSPNDVTTPYHGSPITIPTQNKGSPITSLPQNNGSPNWTHPWYFGSPTCCKFHKCVVSALTYLGEISPPS